MLTALFAVVGSLLSPEARLPRRQFFAAAAAATATIIPPAPSLAIVNGQPVSDGEAAAQGVVGLYIDLAGCKICRKGVPATCTGTLVAPDLVLSARHCSDVPASLNGTLDRVVFGSDMLSSKAVSRDVDRFVSTADYGIDSEAGDLLLIKMKGAAPAPWQPVDLPLSLLPTKAELKEAAKKNSPFSPDGIGLPDVVTYGYGQTDVNGEVDVSKYSAGSLRKLQQSVRTEVRPWGPGFLTTPATKGSGTCAGDSGGGAVLGLVDPAGREQRRILLGVQAAASKPCVDNQAIFIYPQAFDEFLRKASKDLGSKLPASISWRDYL